MPTISRKLLKQYNLKVELRYNDHNPPHLHITCAKEDINWFIDFNGVLREGVVKTKTQRKLYKIIEYWMELHKMELWDRWYKAIKNMPIDYVD